MTPPLELTAAAALFDMDGTLVDSTAVVESLWQRFCGEHGVDVETLLAYSHGRRTPDIVDRFLPDAPAADVDAIVAELEARELDVTDGIVEIPGAAALLSDADRALGRGDLGAARARRTTDGRRRTPPPRGAGAGRRAGARQAAPRGLPACGRAPGRRRAAAAWRSRTPSRACGRHSTPAPGSWWSAASTPSSPEGSTAWPICARRDPPVLTDLARGETVHPWPEPGIDSQGDRPRG